MFVRFSSQYQMNTKNNILYWSKNLRKYILKVLRICLRFFRKIKLLSGYQFLLVNIFEPYYLISSVFSIDVKRMFLFIS